MKIYLAGPMRGIKNHNFAAFDAARDYLVELGHDVVIPADLDSAAGFVTERDGRVELTPAFSIQAALRQDLATICTCDAVAFLPGWEASSGSLVERRVAVDVGCRLFRFYPAAGRLEPELVVGLSGYARAGKDTVAEVIVSRHGFARGSFAAALKRVLVALDPIVLDGRRLSEIDGAVEQTPSGPVLAEAAKEMPEVRRLLQRLGTDAGRSVLGKDVWVNALLERPPGRLVLSDCRFPNEADAIRSRGGVVLRVNRPGVGPINDHESETALDGYRFDAVIDNDGGIDDLAVRVDAAVASAGIDCACSPGAELIDTDAASELAAS